MSVEVNYWGVIVAMLSSMVIGSFWYAQAVFGKRWAKLANVDMSKDRGNMFKPIVTTMVVSLMTAYVLAHVVYLANQFFGRSFLQDSLTTAFWLWLGFTAARFITHDAFEGRPSKLSFINVGNEFFTIMMMGLVIGLFGA